jgi:hypothetical protein
VFTLVQDTSAAARKIAKEKRAYRQL